MWYVPLVLLLLVGCTGENMETKERMPVLFVSHGSPMSVIDDSGFSSAMQQVGLNIPKPKAILVASAHWLDGTKVSCSAEPETIHDFYGFPDELYRLEYKALGSTELSKRVSELLGVGCDERGLDHGAWTPLYHMFPDADIPVVQLSINLNQPVAYHYALAKKLQPLRDEGVLIIGSGSLTHNLREAQWDATEVDARAIAFDKEMQEVLAKKAFSRVVEMDLPNFTWAHPTLDHYLPLVYIVGLVADEDKAVTVFEGYQTKTVSMRSVLFS
ncbi:dioxygenase [Candidatus Woesearchaeota archaeon]|nr:dioxygenase [Candidatus Woesearchaeota archaeon]